MKCEESQARVEEYFDRELDERTAREMTVHLDNCALCSAALEKLAFEHQTYQSYDRELEVSPALWNKVSERFDDENIRQALPVFGPGSRRGQPAWDGSRSQLPFGKLLSLRFSMATSVALVLCAVVVTVAVMKYLNTQETSKQMALSSGTVSEEKSPPAKTDMALAPVESKEVDGRDEGPEIKKGMEAGAGAGGRSRRSLSVKEDASATRAHLGPRRGLSMPEQLVHEAEKKYLSAIALLTRDAEQRPSQLDSETRMKLDGALAAIDRTILSTRKAVKQNPNDPVAVQYMLSAYGKKVEVLKEMSSY